MGSVFFFYYIDIIYIFDYIDIIIIIAVHYTTVYVYNQIIIEINLLYSYKFLLFLLNYFIIEEEN